MEGVLPSAALQVKGGIRISCVIDIVQILLNHTSFFTAQCSEITKIININYPFDVCF